jgi:5'-phosphate synthase pdxT subunit
MMIGILAVQGAFIEHRYMLEQLGVPSFEIRQKRDLLKPMNGIILPGGESTTMGKLLRDLDMLDLLREKIAQGLPTLGTCAGLILLSQKIVGENHHHLGLMDIEVERNAYGRQLSSFYTHDLFDQKTIPMTFIRAPYIKQAGKGVKVLSIVSGRIVAAREKNILVTAFHPELNADLTVHDYFLKMISSSS